MNVRLLILPAVTCLACSMWVWGKHLRLETLKEEFEELSSMGEPSRKPEPFIPMATRLHLAATEDREISEAQPSLTENVVQEISLEELAEQLGLSPDEALAFEEEDFTALWELFSKMGFEELYERLKKCEASELPKDEANRLRRMIHRAMVKNHPASVFQYLVKTVKDLENIDFREFAYRNWMDADPNAAQAWLSEALQSGFFHRKELDPRSDIKEALHSIVYGKRYSQNPKLADVYLDTLPLEERRKVFLQSVPRKLNKGQLIDFVKHRLARVAEFNAGLEKSDPSVIDDDYNLGFHLGSYDLKTVEHIFKAVPLEDGVKWQASERAATRHLKADQSPENFVALDRWLRRMNPDNRRSVFLNAAETFTRKRHGYHDLTPAKREKLRKSRQVFLEGIKATEDEELFKTLEKEFNKP